MSSPAARFSRSVVATASLVGNNQLNASDARSSCLTIPRDDLAHELQYSVSQSINNMVLRLMDHGIPSVLGPRRALLQEEHYPRVALGKARQTLFTTLCPKLAVLTHRVLISPIGDRGPFPWSRETSESLP